MFLYLVTVLVVILFFCWKSYMDGFKKWSHLPGVKPHWFWGNKPFFSKNMKDIYVDHYKALDGHRFGVFWSTNEPCIFLRDLDLIKRVQVTDFDHFTLFGFNKPRKFRIINQFGLAELEVDAWKKLKRAVTPSFSITRLKKNIASMNDSANKTVGYLHAQENKEFVNVTEFSKKYYLQCVASVAFGLNIDVFSSQETTFEKNAKVVFNMFSFLMDEMFPTIADILGIEIIHKKFNKYLTKLCRDVVKQRENKNLQYDDILNNLIEVSKEHPEMTEEIMIKTCVQFFGDGYETAAVTFGVLAYYLAVYPDVQEKLQEEIDEVFDSKDDGEDINQDDINSMKYLEQVLLEGQRLAPLSNTGRTCTKDWQVPGDTFVIPKGTRVLIPTSALHFDPQYWPDPLIFDPERFSSENKSSFDNITFQTFGFGPRACLGRNLYHVETKVLVAHLLRSFSLRPYGDMPKVMEWDQHAFIGKEKYEVKIERRN